MMTIEGLIAVVSLVLTAFGLGYTSLDLDIQSEVTTQKNNRPKPSKLSGYFLLKS